MLRQRARGTCDPAGPVSVRSCFLPLPALSSRVIWSTVGTVISWGKQGLPLAGARLQFPSLAPARDSWRNSSFWGAIVSIVWSQVRLFKAPFCWAGELDPRLLCKSQLQWSCVSSQSLGYRDWQISRAHSLISHPNVIGELWVQKETLSQKIKMETDRVRHQRAACGTCEWHTHTCKHTLMYLQVHDHMSTQTCTHTYTSNTPILKSKWEVFSLARVSTTEVKNRGYQMFPVCDVTLISNPIGCLGLLLGPILSLIVCGERI